MASTVLVTGASQGIGKETALLFARKGYNVVLAARDADKLEAVATEIQRQGNHALPIPTDVTDFGQVHALAESALASYGAINVLVNNAGICMNGEMADTSLEDWHRIIDLNLYGYIHTITALLPQFLAQGNGTIINVGSFGGKVPLPKMTAYCTSKFAVTGLTETLRLELASKGIQVCGVHPGVTNTSFLERTSFLGDNTEGLEKQMQEVLNSPLTSQPEEVARAIWNMVKHPQAEVVIGAASLPTTAYRLVPGLTQWAMQQVAKSSS
jgi:short-subunit dehydrogenase